jgi:hypothetical protein
MVRQKAMAERQSKAKLLTSWHPGGREREIRHARFKVYLPTTHCP